MADRVYFSVRDIYFTELNNGYQITIFSDIPCHLFMRWSLVEPQIHKQAVLRRGIYMHTDVYLCFVGYHDNEQEEAGDTYLHTFYKVPWPCCETRFFHFWGTIGGSVSVSTTALFKKHSTAPAQLTILALGTSGHVLNIDDSYTACRNSWTGLPLYGVGHITIGQAKEGMIGYMIWRGGLFFDTTSVPKGGLISEAKIRFTKISGGVFSAINDPDQCLVIRDWPTHYYPPLQNHHFGALQIPVHDCGQVCRDGWAGVAFTEIDVPLNSFGLTQINPGGQTWYSMRGSHDINNIPDVGFIEHNRYDFFVTGPDLIEYLWLIIEYRCKAGYEPPPPPTIWQEPWGTFLTQNNPWVLISDPNPPVITFDNSIIKLDFTLTPHSGIIYNAPSDTIPLMSPSGQPLYLHTINTKVVSANPFDNIANMVLFRKDGYFLSLYLMIKGSTIGWGSGAYGFQSTPPNDNAWLYIGEGDHIIDMFDFFKRAAGDLGIDPNPEGWFVNLVEIAHADPVPVLPSYLENDLISLFYV